MADNILDDDSQRGESLQAAKKMRLDSYHEDSACVPLSPPETEMFEEASHPIEVLEGLNRLRLNSVLCDVTLCCEGQEFPCHRYVLASCSSYFEAMFTSGMRESTQERVTMSGVESQSISLLVNYAYTAKVPISYANVQALLAASDLLDITAVKEACCDYMTRHIHIDNCVDIYCCADDHSCEFLVDNSFDYILEHFVEIYHQEEFLSLSVERVTDILGSDDLNVPKEDLVFEAAMLWLDKCPTHRQSFEKVLDKIRLPLISPSYLHTVVERLDVVKDHQGCQRFISEAKERPYCNTARPRRTTVIVTVGRKTKQESERKRIKKRHLLWEKKEQGDKVECFDPLTSQWSTLGRLPLSIIRYAVVMSGSYLYVAGGRNGYINGASRKMWRYDVQDDSWLEMAPMNVERNDFMEEVRCKPHLCRLRLQEGRSLRPWYPDLDRSIPKSTDIVSSLFEMQSYGISFIPASYIGPVLADSGMVVMLGRYMFAVSGQGDEKSKDSIDRYDFYTNTWQLMESVGVAAYYHNRVEVVALDGLLYFFGTPTEPDVAQVAKFNPETSVWSEVPPMQILRQFPAVCALNGKIYAIGGRKYYNVDHYNEVHGPYKKGTRVFENTVECFNPMTNLWTMCAPVQTKRWKHSVVVLDGNIYIVGGQDSFSPQLTIERYCEEMDTWETVGQEPDGCSDGIGRYLPLKLRNDRDLDDYEYADDGSDEHLNRDYDDDEY